MKYLFSSMIKVELRLQVEKPLYAREPFFVLLGPALANSITVTNPRRPEVRSY